MHFQVADATDASQIWQTASPSVVADGIYVTHSAAKEWLRAASFPALVTLHIPRIATAALGLPADTLAARAPHCQLHVLVLFAASMCRSCKRLRIGMRKAAGMHSQCMNLDAASEGLSDAQAVGSSMTVSPVYSLQQAGHKGVAMLWLNEPVLDAHASHSTPAPSTAIMAWLVGSVTMGRAIQKALPTSISEAQHALSSIASQLTSTALRAVLAEVETAKRPTHHHQPLHHHAAHHLTQKAFASPTPRAQAHRAAKETMRHDAPGPRGLLSWLTFTREWLEHFEQDIACAAHGEDLLTSVRLAMQLAARAIEAAGAMPGSASKPAAAPPPPLPSAGDRRRASSTQASPPKLQWPTRPQAHVWGMDATQALGRTARPGSARLSSSFLAQSAVAGAKANLRASYQSPSSTISSFAGSYDASALRERTVVLDGDAVPSAAFAAAQQSLHRPRLQRAQPAPPEPGTRLSASFRPGTGGAIATPALARRHQVLTMANGTRHP